VLSAGEVAKLRNAGFIIDIIREDYSKFISERNKAAEQESGKLIGRSAQKAQNHTLILFPCISKLGSMGGYYTPLQVLNELDSMVYFYPGLISQKAVFREPSHCRRHNLYYVRFPTPLTRPRINPKSNITRSFMPVSPWDASS